MVKLPDKSLERKLIAGGCRHIIGVDEVGMGCLAGPVVVCAVLFPSDFFRRRRRGLERLRDSKLLSGAQRNYYATQLARTAGVRFSFAVVPVAEVDRLNVYHAARAGMRRAVHKLRPALRSHVLVDGPRQVAGLTLPQSAVVRGDRTVFAIAAASVLAKAHRDAMMIRFAKRYPGYGLEAHKGYATKTHRLALSALGPCPLHRRSFRLTGA